LTSGERVSYVSESIEIPVEARMFRRGDRWYIYDVSIEGISLVNNYRSQFNAIIQKSSYEQLVQRLRATREVSLNDQ